jgi:saccharopine dehydrogenase-like NADP-dependent oxidoreductase
MRRVRELAADASTAVIPQCGLAPGFVSIVAFDMAKRFEILDSVKLRVGALPQYPSNALNYNLTWSTDGVINEYCEPCEAIVNGVAARYRRWRSGRNTSWLKNHVPLSLKLEIEKLCIYNQI